MRTSCYRSDSRLKICKGSSRIVAVSGRIAAKFPRGALGLRCNLFEAQIWAKHRHHSTRRPHLCPVLWCHPEGLVLIMPAVAPLPAGTYPRTRLPEDWWDYMGPGDDEDPTEPKAEDWGILDGELVAIDYASSVL